ncbi:MAG: response regulator [Candidatus Fervidibacter sp.]|uniref:response regulator n=1 Tax=Candidatus Fervidibacter sp. TaxID=3100871 RepID=UPI00404A9B7C
MKRSLHIVLIDDNLDDQLLVARYLQQEFSDLRISPISKPEDFKATLEEGGFDIVITDYQLHWTDGFSVLRRIKACYPDCPVIMFTATGSEEIAVEAMKAGFDDYVIKTAKHLPRLVAAVRVAIERMEEKVKAREMEERYRQLFTSLPVGIFRASPDGRWMEANPAMLKILRAETERSLTYHSLWHLFANSPDREQAFRQLLESEQLSLPQVLLIRFDGSNFWARLEATLTRDISGNFRWIDGVIMDVTPLVSAEREQAKTLAVLQTLVDHLPEGIALIDENWYIVMSNSKAENMLAALGHKRGLPLAMLGGKPIGEFLSPSPRGLWHELTSSGRVYEIAIYSATNHNRILVIRDVTSEREIGRRLEIQERLAAIGELAAGLAHDFNNILSSIVGEAELLSMRSDLRPDIREFVNMVITQGERSANLIRKILDFSRRTTSEQRTTDVALFLHDCVQFLSRILPENISVVTDIPPGPYIANIDIVQMQQVITNLVVNARDAMPEGGELTIGLRKLVIDETTRLPIPTMQKGKWLVITVSDTGTGIPPEHLPYIFEPFFTTKENGTGLGLSQVYGIVTQHDGFVDVQSEVGKGTTFIIYLPAASTASVTPISEETADVPMGDGELILVAEDEDGVRLVIHRMLERLNYRVISARDGLEALKLYEQYKDKIALVLTDLVMPELGGDRLISELRKRDAKVKVVVMSGYLVGEEQKFIQAPNIFGWLQKPPRFKDLARTIHEVIYTAENG